VIDRVPRLLLIEDDAKIGAYVEKGLRQEGHTIDWARDGRTGLALLLEARHALAVVDVMLPELAGDELIRRARAGGLRTPILVLSARSDVQDRVAGLAAGADEYLVKPFSFVELVARIDALLRRADAPAAPVTRLEYQGLELDLLTRRARRAGRTIELQPKEFTLLEYLMRHPDRVMSKTMILEHVWDYTFDPQTNVVDVLVCRLRGKIDREGEPRLIHTIRGVGYVLRAE
jgi:two-component system OmpR family response regulator